MSGGVPKARRLQPLSAEILNGVEHELHQGGVVADPSGSHVADRHGNPFGGLLLQQFRHPWLREVDAHDGDSNAPAAAQGAPSRWQTRRPCRHRQTQPATPPPGRSRRPRNGPRPKRRSWPQPSDRGARRGGRQTQRCSPRSSWQAFVRCRVEYSTPVRGAPTRRPRISYACSGGITLRSAGTTLARFPAASGLILRSVVRRPKNHFRLCHRPGQG